MAQVNQVIVDGAGNRASQAIVVIVAIQEKMDYLQVRAIAVIAEEA